MRWLPGWILVALIAAPLAAQVPTPERLREQVILRFMQNYRTQAGLTDEQFARFQTTARRSWEERREIQQRERRVFQALGEQMRPGIAADPDSVQVLIDEALAIQEGRAALARREQDAYAEFLSPVQRAQLILSWARLEQQIETILQRRADQLNPQRRRNE